MSRLQSDHSICTALMGCTACARLIVSGLASESPMYFTFPSSTNFLSSPICHNSNHTKNSFKINPRTTTNKPQRSQFLQWEWSDQFCADNRDQYNQLRVAQGSPRSKPSHISACHSQPSYQNWGLSQIWKPTGFFLLVILSRPTNIHPQLHTEMYKHMDICSKRTYMCIYLANQDLIGMGSIDIGGVEESDPIVECMFDDRDSDLVVDRRVVGP